MHEHAHPWMAMWNGVLAVLCLFSLLLGLCIHTLLRRMYD